MRITTTDDDDDRFIEIVNAGIEALVHRDTPRTLRVIRVDNWFGEKWRGFAGKLLGAFGVGRGRLVIPPFVPSRVDSEYSWIKRESGYVVDSDSDVLHKRLRSEANLRRYRAKRFPPMAKRQARNMSHNLIIILGYTLLVGCSTERLPKPHEGFSHPASEHGYWRELAGKKPRIGELRLHAGSMSVTYEPFETYKDYWGSYSLDRPRERIMINVDGGNELPGFSTVSGKYSISVDTLVITGVPLDPRRPGVTVFRFERFNSDQ